MNNMDKITNNNQSFTDDITHQHDDVHFLFAKQLFRAYLKYDRESRTLHIEEMASILLSSYTTPPVTTTATTTIITTSEATKSLFESSQAMSPQSSNTTSTPLESRFKSFIQLRSQYIGRIDENNNYDNEDVIPNATLFHAALLTNKPTIIDDIMQYINFDFTTLNIPHDQHFLIRQTNAINCKYSHQLLVENYILTAVVDATEKGHYESIIHLITNYQLSPTIPIYDLYQYDDIQYTNLFYYSTLSNNLQLITYLLPFATVLQNIRSQSFIESICNIAERGHLDLIKQVQDEYNINLLRMRNEDGQNLLHFAVQSTNIALLDYLIDIIGINPLHQSDEILELAIDADRWNNVQHLITKYNVPIEEVSSPLYAALQCKDITIDTIDYIIQTFDISEDEINIQGDTIYAPPLFQCVQNNNIAAAKHLIKQYNVNPCGLYWLNTLLHSIFQYDDLQPPSLEMLEYLYQLGIDINQQNDDNQTAIQLMVENQYKNVTQQYTLQIFKSLLQHGAVIDDVYQIIQRAVRNNHWSIVHYLIQTHQPRIHVNRFDFDGRSLLNQAVNAKDQPVDFISYLLSLNIINVNQRDKHFQTPMVYAIINDNININVIKLLIQYGAIITRHDWFTMFNRIKYTNPYSLFECLDYLQDNFNYNIQHILPSERGDHSQPLLQLLFNGSQFKLSRLHHHKYQFHFTIIYRTYIHRYKVTVNDQDVEEQNTILHYLAQYNQIGLIIFTLLQSDSKPNIYLVNKKGETFLHTLVSNQSDLDRNTYDWSNELENVIDCLIESTNLVQ